MGTKCRKVSRRDMAIVIAERGYGATTVAGTMYCANLAGIKLFVTGGIGGVHRGAEHTLDISADLTELGRTPVAVVCAGVKSILDIPKTLEYLETQGVSVVSYQSQQFPAFFTRTSGCQAPLTLDSAKECAQLVAANASLNMQSGMIFAVPIPMQFEAEGAEIQRAIDRALREAE
jgi:pseudouridylate synthase